MKRIFAAALLTLSLNALPAIAETKRWTLDLGHAHFGWKIDHFGYSSTVGVFRKFDGTFEIDEQHPERSQVTFVVDAASIDSNHIGRDTHLRAADLLNVAKHPEIAFTSTHVKMHDATSGKIIGDLTFMGTTKPLTLDFVVTGDASYAAFLPNYDELRAVGFEATGRIDRIEHGLDALNFPGSPLGHFIDLDIHFDLTDCTAAPETNIPCNWGRVEGFKGPNE